MFRDFIEKAKDQKDNLPNKFSETLGELIRKARSESKLSQAELAEQAYLSQAAVSQIEQGKRSVSAEEIVYLSVALNKPIAYFFPTNQIQNSEIINLSIQEQELIELIRKLPGDEIKKAIILVKAISEL